MVQNRNKFLARVFLLSFFADPDFTQSSLPFKLFLTD